MKWDKANGPVRRDGTGRLRYCHLGVCHPELEKVLSEMRDNFIYEVVGLPPLRNVQDEGVSHLVRHLAEQFHHALPLHRREVHPRRSNFVTGDL
jgi:hypothetical protein